jgi:hypothetical protein
VIEQAVASVGSLDQKRIGDYIKTHSFETNRTAKRDDAEFTTEQHSLFW